MTHKIKDNKVAVSTDTYWLPIDEHTPRGVKVQAISRHLSGIAQYTELRSSNLNYYDYWCPVPQFMKDEL